MVPRQLLYGSQSDDVVEAMLVLILAPATDRVHVANVVVRRDERDISFIGRFTTGIFYIQLAPPTHFAHSRCSLEQLPK